MIKFGIIGANGYGGGELLRLLSQHPQVELGMIASRSQEGKRLEEVFPTFWGHPWGKVTFVDSEDPSCTAGCDLVFMAVPHGVSAKLGPALLAQGARLIDLGADFRFKDPKVYSEWYKVEHQAPELLAEAVYGLPELFRDELPGARVVGNPGCYPTATLLGLAPLVKAGLIDPDRIIIDAKSGFSGSGRTAKPELVCGETADNMRAYGVATHRHTPEIEAVVARLASRPVTVSFTPHVVPMPRGILSTLHLTLRQPATTADLIDVFNAAYMKEPFVCVLPEPYLPETKGVLGSNRCQIGVRADRRTGQAIVVSVIDNLVKGMAGQAIQNMNLMFGLEETTGLLHPGMWP
ncbi:MAG TPA: N-acetyl-gamma-glutamyl-phosphate reductase [Firmicutes bacterium]|nr:N-acetyl-gamma-glutamyl-phosphate reductase [Bacillota bacterium]HOQ24330.1 N-acetyl-gamma-glutamyl-phosphate reductase [Bacillota bacterium]HPT67490.1 N-acetyl-gamma-glutamyl-phosphate reductase [Bacillota bacterium]